MSGEWPPMPGVSSYKDSEYEGNFGLGYHGLGEDLDEAPEEEGLGPGSIRRQEARKFQACFVRVAQALERRGLLVGNDYESDEEKDEELTYNQGGRGEFRPWTNNARAAHLLACQVHKYESELQGSQEGLTTDGDEDEKALAEVIEELISRDGQHEADFLHAWVEVAEEFLGEFEFFRGTSSGTPEREVQMLLLYSRVSEFDNMEMEAGINGEMLRIEVAGILEDVYGYANEARQLVEVCFSAANTYRKEGDAPEELDEFSNRRNEKNEKENIEEARRLAERVGVPENVSEALVDTIREFFFYEYYTQTDARA